MKLSRLVVRLSALGIAAILALPFAFEQVSAFGNAADGEVSQVTVETFARTASLDDASDEVSDPTLRARGPASTEPATSNSAAKGSKTVDASASVQTAAAPAQPTTAAPEVAQAVTQNDWGVDPATLLKDASATVVFDGAVARKKKNTPRWSATKFVPSETGTHKFTLDWAGDANLKFAVYDAKTRKRVAANTTKKEPKKLKTKLTEGKDYRLVVWAGRGKATFAVVMTAAPNKADDKTPTTTTTKAPKATTTTAPPTPAVGGKYPGRPAKGNLFWGAALAGNDDPGKRHEQPAGHPMTLRRSFFQWRHRTGYMIDIAKDDLNSGRLPWVSVKTPSWADMAAGKHDNEIDQMLKALDALKGPVWLTIHHEPEGGGGKNYPDDPAGPAGHVAMNERVRQRMDALKTDNIALAPVLMAWTWDSKSGRNPNEWWKDGIYDFIGIDHYDEAGQSLLTGLWYDVREWAGKRGMDVAVGEWGLRGTDTKAGNLVRAWYNDAAKSHKDGRGARVVGLAAFDSAVNATTGSFELKGEQLKAFHELMNDKRTADPL